MNVFLFIFGIILIILIILAAKAKTARQLKFINRYYFHKGITKKLLQKHPQLTADQVAMVFQCLRDYFRISHTAKKRMVAMPSQVVDDAWHEFILSTRSYDEFCNKAFGRFLHHTPAEAMPTPTSAKEGIKRTWRLACAMEHIHPKTPTRLPLLFAIDRLLNIENGYVYQLDCMAGNVSGFCASHIGCTSGCAGDTGFDSSSDSGSDAGSGCSGDSGGGCGGGGD